MSREIIVNKIIDSRIVAIMKLDSIENILDIADALLMGGIKTLELTLTTPEAYEGLEELNKKFGDEILLGAGSVLSPQDAINSINVGAEFIVSPILNFDIVSATHTMDKPVIPGAFTPTEIYAAHQAGADIIKVFPADILGMRFFKAIKGPMPSLNIMPTGGVSLTNPKEWLAAGACAVGIGHALVDSNAVAEKRYNIITANARTIIENLK